MRNWSIVLAFENTDTITIWAMCSENVPSGENFRKSFFAFCDELDLGDEKLQ